jgi:uncharacterized phosphosugar-binding protein
MKTRVDHGFIIPLLAFTLIGAFIALALFTTYKKTHETNGLMIADHVQELSDIFTKIHKSCGIISFDYQKNPINFLTVKSFVGSEVGSMNLAHPKKWRGPYVAEGSSIQPDDYQIVRTTSGYFITPGEGCILPNGSVVGEDVLLHENAHILTMIQPGGVLNHNGKALAAPISTQVQEAPQMADYEVE